MGLEWALTAEENLHFFARLSGMPIALAKHRSDEALRALDLWADRGKSVSALSNGMRQRVIMARALLWHTPVVLLDEPLVGLDPHHRHALLQLIEGLARQRGQTVVISYHDTEAVATLADRVVLLAQGQVAGYGTAPDLVERLCDRRIVDPVTTGAGTPDAVRPAAMSRVVHRPRPGPLGQVQWQVTVDARQSGALMEVIAWLVLLNQVAVVALNAPFKTLSEAFWDKRLQTYRLATRVAGAVRHGLTGSRAGRVGHIRVVDDASRRPRQCAGRVAVAGASQWGAGFDGGEPLLSPGARPDNLGLRLPDSSRDRPLYPSGSLARLAGGAGPGVTPNVCFTSCGWPCCRGLRCLL